MNQYKEHTQTCINSYRELFLHNNADSYEISEFDLASDAVLADLTSKGYSRTTIKVTCQAIKEFRIFLQTNELSFSNAMINRWLEMNEIGWSRPKYRGFRRALLLVDEILFTGNITTKRFAPVRAALPDWSVPAFSEYLRERVQGGLAKKTINMTYNSCKRFIKYLDSHNVHDWENITPSLVKNFHDSSFHSTAAGRNACAYKVRNFLAYLSLKGYVPDTLYLAMTSVSAKRSRVVRILDACQIQSIYYYRDAATTPAGLRNIAIILLGLRAGLRASDISNLRLHDISWSDKTISISQKKTGKFLVLPLATDAGNAVWRYIHNARPVQSKTDAVFISHKAPFQELSPHICNKALRAVVGDCGGFHITRRTFASGLLEAGNDTDIISFALGHSTKESLDTYLSTDGERMRLCALDLDGIEYQGGLL